ncbi:hypothetical protein HHI36_011226 [Cryptolaemus montrouzieri]|uniref:Uncharacterized protein n=1 Tax=Cryptolaemus montrouzieri TaxID=559131 RepID=A0ABD2MLY7_9CUCU
MGRVQNHISEEKIIEYIKAKPGYTVKELAFKTKMGKSSILESFLVEVSFSSKDELYNPQFLPANVSIKRFNFHLYEKNHLAGNFFMVQSKETSIQLIYLSYSSDHKNIQKIDQKLFSIIHRNMQSTGIFVDVLEHPFQDHKNCMILCITEHWRCEEELIPKVNDLNLVSFVCRRKEKHVGAAVCINEKLSSEPRKELNDLSLGQFECGAAE